MRVLLLTRYTRMCASSRLRSFQYLEPLRAAGVEVQVQALLDDDYLHTIYRGDRVSPAHLVRLYAHRLAVLHRARDFDLLWIEKELFPNWPSLFEWMLRKAGVPYLVDYDDAIFHNYGLSRNPLKRMLGKKIGNVMRHAATVVAGNQYLLQHAREAGAARTVFLPTVVDIRRYPAAEADERPPAKPLVVGWIGSPSTARYLRPLLPVLARLARRYPMEFAVVGAELAAKGYDFVRHVPWSEETEAAEIARFDIGVMPLPDGPWEQGKCGYKLIQYMACAKPVVASPVGVNADIVSNGEAGNGFLATSGDEWFDALSRLLGDAALRRSMGRRGRMLAEEKYSLQASMPRLLQLLEDAASFGELPYADATAGSGRTR